METASLALIQIPIRGEQAWNHPFDLQLQASSKDYT
jgi:hypothetical protein